MRSKWAERVMDQPEVAPKFGVLDRIARAVGRWPIALGVFAIVAVALAVAAFLAPATYASRGVLLISPQDNLANLNGHTPEGARSLSAIVDAEVDRLNSRAMATELAGGTLSVSGEPISAEAVKRSLRAWRRDGAYVVNVEARASSPQEARRIAAAAINAYLGGAPHAEVVRTSRFTSSALLKEQVETARANLAAKTAQREAIVASEAWKAQQKGGTLAPAAAEAKRQLDAARSAQDGASRRASTLKAFWRSGMSPEAVAKLRASNVVQDLGEKAARLDAALDDYEKQLATAEPDPKALETDRFALETALALLVSDLDGEAPGLAASMRTAQARFDTAMLTAGGAASGASLRVRVETLDREIADGRSAVQTLEQTLAEAEKLGTANAAMASATTNLTDVRVVAPAGEPFLPLTSQKRVRLGAALGVALIIALAGLVILELTTNTVSSPREIESLVNAPVLAVAPQIAASQLRALSPNERHPAYFAVERPASPFADAIRDLHTEIFAALEPGARLTLAVTSSQRGDGASTVALSLARAAVAAGQRVLIIDGDLGEAGLTSVVGIDSDAGVETVLAGQGRILDLIVGDDVSSASILTANVARGPGGSLSLAQLSAFKLALETARPVFDLVIIDCPSPEAGSRSRALARLADRALIVAAANVTRRVQLRSLARRLEHGGARICGAVMNMAPTPRSYVSLVFRRKETGPAPSLNRPSAAKESGLRPRRSLH